MELVVSDIEEFERREAEDYRGELAGEEVVAYIKLVKEAEEVEAFGESAFEPVRVQVEQSEIG